MSRRLHIVCLDCPSPPDYGGAIDMFYKIKALCEAGEEIILHYFDYNPNRTTKEIEPYCKEIYTYQRKSLFRSLPLIRPYIVESRLNDALVERLNRDDDPVLLEGLHCSGIVPSLRNKERIVLRMHNEEASYYRHLAETEGSALKRNYFRQESRLLRRYQQGFDKEIKMACLSQTDMEQLAKAYQFRQLHFVPCFTPWQQVKSRTGRGEYCLYHGNLSVSENNEAALWLIENVFLQIPLPLVIAGKGISKKLETLAKRLTQVHLVNDPPQDELDALIADAHINVLPSLNRTGVKLKLLHALLEGRHCLTNDAGINGSNIRRGVALANSVDEWKSKLSLLMTQDFLQQDVEEREEVLSLYNNWRSAQTFSALWTHCR